MDFFFDHLEIVALVLYFAVFFISKIFLGTKSDDSETPHRNALPKSARRKHDYPVNDVQLDDEGTLSRKYAAESDSGKFYEDDDRDIASRYGNAAEGKFFDDEDNAETPRDTQYRPADENCEQFADASTAETFQQGENDAEYTEPNPASKHTDTVPAENISASIRDLFAGGDALKRAFIVSEVLNKPKSLKDADRII